MRYSNGISIINTIVEKAMLRIPSYGSLSPLPVVAELKSVNLTAV